MSRSVADGAVEIAPTTSMERRDGAKRPPTRLNLGSGWDELEGYVNVDLHAVHRPHVLADVRALPIRDGAVSVIRAYDILEHLPRTDTVAALEGWVRALIPGGTVELQVPELRGLLKMLEVETFERHHHVNHLLYGTQAYTGDFHQAGFTDLTLADQLYRAGLRDVSISLDWGKWLARVVATKPEDGGGCSVAVSWCTGFFERESDEESVWHWAGPDAVLRLINPLEQPVRLCLESGLRCHSDRSGTVELGGTTAVVEAGVGNWSAELAIPPGATDLPLTTDLPRIAAEMDPRPLHVALRDFSLIPVSRTGGSAPPGGRRSGVRRWIP